MTGTRATTTTALAVALLLAVFSGALAGCTDTLSAEIWSADPGSPPRPPLSQLEKNLRRISAHISEFSPVSEPLALPKCGHVRPPEALLTPDPPLPGPDDDVNVRVSFVIGSDGHVYSAFILDGSNPDEDRMFLRAVRTWRYRPALCNGVPTDSEARVRFTLR